MDDLDEEEQNQIASNIAWLESTGPDDWHRVALDFNWSEPLYLLDWIVRQTDCDMATALTIFWKGEPSSWLEEDGSSSEKPNGYSYLSKKICAYIAGRIEAGGYARSKIAYTPEIWTKKDYADLVAKEKSLANPNFRTHPDLIRKRSGRKIVNDENFYRRYPENFRHTFDCELPGDSPRSIALMESVERIAQATRRLLPSWLRR
jgi:hypothetical protein